jgi:CDP-diacylglycerol---serine O-phosphatidyltransferase
MSIKNNIPNSITLLNLLSGILSIYFGTLGELQFSAAMIFVAAFFDFLDGLFARLLNAKSPIGAQLDSLADVVSFGVAPAFVLFHTINMVNEMNGDSGLGYLAFFAFIVPLFSALRLAKFNIDENQTTSFVGLPTPAVGLLLASFPIMILVCLAEDKGLYYDLVTNAYFLAGVAIVSSLLMVSKLPMFALKFKSVSWAENQSRYIFIILSFFLLVLLKMAAIPIIVLLYLLLSIVFFFMKNKEGQY